MHRRVDPSPELLQLARLQDGVLSREQVRGHGLGPGSVDRLLAQGRWTSLATGLLVASGEPPTWRGLAWAGVLLAGDDAALGGLAACHLHGLAETAPAQIDVWTSRQVRVAGPWRFRRRGREHGRSPRHDPPRISAEEAVLDVCDEVTATAALGYVMAAVQQRRTSVVRLRKVLAQRSRNRHRRLLLGVLDEVTEGVESPLERAYLHRVERAHALPRGTRQHRGAGGRRRDVGYPGYGLVVELDGRFHEGAGRARDMRRDNAAVLSGERVLRFGWHDVDGDPCGAARQTAQLLRLGGWSGAAGRCPCCPDPDTVFDLTW